MEKGRMQREYDTLALQLKLANMGCNPPLPFPLPQPSMSVRGGVRLLAQIFKRWQRKSG